MPKKKDEEFVSREDAARDLRALADSIEKGDPETRVSFYVHFSFRRMPMGAKS